MRHKIARRNINNLRFADDTTLMAESEEELKIQGFLLREACIPVLVGGAGLLSGVQ